jgi:nucleoside-diphosphate-sugar epimerase
LARHPERIASDIRNDSRVKIIQADVLDYPTLLEAVKGQDLVYANLYGRNLGEQGKSIAKAMQEAGVKRIIWISANGIYGEIPGEYGNWNAMMLGGTLKAYSQGAEAIETTDLDYTIVRPAWFSDKDEVNYEITQKGEPFKGTEVSRKSVAAYVTSLIVDPSQEIRSSVGINEPNTDGAKPSFY